MSRQTGATLAPHFQRGWIYVLLLALVTINYNDRPALAVVRAGGAQQIQALAGSDGLPVLILPVVGRALPLP
jgi:hypothetical protein